MWHRERGRCTGASCSSSRSRWSRRAPSPWRQPHPRPRVRRANPRTAKRELVTGELSVRSAWVGDADRARDLPGRGRRPVVAVLLRSPRSRWSCSCSTRTASASPTSRRRCSALAQFVAPVGRLDRGHRHSSWAPSLLGLAVGIWIGGFDLIYSCQDAEVDRQIGSRSFPARFGIAVALRTSSVVHVVTFASFAWFGAAAGLGWLWWIGLALTAGVLVYEHRIVGPTTCHASTGPSSPPTGSSASGCSPSRWRT